MIGVLPDPSSALRGAPEDSPATMPTPPPLADPADDAGDPPFLLERAAHELLVAMPSIVYVYDVREERSVFQNRRLEELLGFAVGETIEPGESSWRRLIHPEDAARFPAHRERLRELADGESAVFEYRMRHADGEWRWLLSRDVPYRRDQDGRLRYVLGSTADISEQKRTEAALRQHERKLELLLRELDHRVKNTLTIVQSLALQTHLGTDGVEAFTVAFGQRLHALAAAHDVLAGEGWQGAALADVVKASLAPFASEGQERVRVSGPEVRLSGAKAMSVGMALHELATNAVKYGALAENGGAVEIAWQRAAEAPAGIELSWRERGGPPVTPPLVTGFGTRLLHRVVVEELGGEVALDYRREGFSCHLWLPVSDHLVVR
jgi:PAS domain S-box-containing protein